MEKRVILGTAGHIDHGKTALVKALTGVDTDRLKEEKQRGITIELGFTSLSLPSGLQLGVVDVPGHERFIDHMVAGATGIDLVLLVVAADEGVMPQTVEHLEICRLLGIKTGLVALTKTDLVDEEMQALAMEDVMETIQDTFLEGSPIVPFSSLTGEGHQKLVEELSRIAINVKEKKTDTIARMPIDRVFTIKGFGTVVTGTLLSGKLSLSDNVEILPSGHKAKIRGLQVHNQAVKETVAGSRTAINLQGINRELIQRGEILSEPDYFHPSFRIYAHFNYLRQAARALPNRFRLMIHWGTTRVFGRISFLEQRSTMEPGSDGLVQIFLESPIFPVVGDKLIARDFSTNQTLGGGVILDPLSSKFRAKNRAVLLPWLQRLRGEDPNDQASYFFWKHGIQGSTVKELSAWGQLSIQQAQDLCQKLTIQGKLIAYDSEQMAYIYIEAFQALVQQILEITQLFHQEKPYQSGLPKEALHGKLKEPVPEKLLGFTFSWLADKGKIVTEKDRLRLITHQVQLTAQDEAIYRKIKQIFIEKGNMPPSLKELVEQTGHQESRLRAIMEYLVNQKKIIKVNEDLYYLADILEEIKTRLVDFLQQKGEIQTGEFKTLSETTRKYTIPLLEYFDRIRLTLRLDDRRKLRDKKS